MSMFVLQLDVGCGSPGEQSMFVLQQIKRKNNVRATNHFGLRIYFSHSVRSSERQFSLIYVH
jgi:hypothetical protein